MPDEEDWLWRPVAEGLCSYTDVIEGRVSLLDIRRMHTILNVRNENRRRIDEWWRNHRINE